MLVLLPPSETKRSGGGSAVLDLDALAFRGLRAQRERVLRAVEQLSRDPAEAARVLKLGPTQRDAIAVNAALRSAPTMAAVDRYTGVLYDALDAASLDAPARRWLGAHVAIQTALLGPVMAGDRIPSYRLGATASLPGCPPLRRVWAAAVSGSLAELPTSFVLDLRSEAYVGLGPVPDSLPSAYVRVVTEGPDGAVRALNHFNKHAKGALVRMLATQRPRIRNRRAFTAWADAQGLRVDERPDGELALFA